MINPHSSEPFPPPPRFDDNSPAARRARVVRVRMRFLGALLAVGVVFLALGNYLAGGIMVGWAIFRLGMLGWRVRTRRRRFRERRGL